MDIKRILAATLLSALILIGFDYFMPKPHPDTHATVTQISATGSTGVSAPPANNAGSDEAAVPARRIDIRSADLQGSLTLRGALIDDAVLTQYRETLAKDSPLVRLLDKAGSAHPNFFVIGWENAPGSNAKLPAMDTLWSSEDQALSPGHPVMLTWDNGEGLLFTIKLALDEHYMFSVQQSVENHSNQPVALVPFQRVQRDYEAPEGSFVAHEGPIAVMDGRLNDEKYKNVRSGADHPDHTAWSKTGTGGWAGISDKYWLTAIAPDSAASAMASFAYVPGNPGSYRIGFQAPSPQQIMPNGAVTQISHIFAGAKVPGMLQSYGRDLHITDFDKAIDFGWFSFLTRPILYLLHWLYMHLGNFGLALMALTLIVKIILFPLASKAAASSARMRMLAPKIKEIREQGKDDPMAMNQKVMALYKSEGVNPASGCLPALIQAPIFFCLYKMLNLSIDERHAPFFGWIRDLSVPDPTNIFNLFGLLPFDPTHYVSFLHVSVWGAAMGVTFWFLQRQTTAGAGAMDPAQARMMQFMPLLYVFFMSGFPAGLLVYYTWNNILTIAQQAFIQSRTKLPISIVKKGR